MVIVEISATQLQRYPSATIFPLFLNHYGADFFFQFRGLVWIFMFFRVVIIFVVREVGNQGIYFYVCVFSSQPLHFHNKIFFYLWL